MSKEQRQELSSDSPDLNLSQASADGQRFDMQQHINGRIPDEIDENVEINYIDCSPLPP